MAKKRSRRINTIFTIATGALAAAAVTDQLRRPAAERTWHGTILNIPYDFRRPTAERLQKSFWDRDNPSIFVPHAFGIGWSINFYPILNLDSTQA